MTPATPAIATDPVGRGPVRAVTAAALFDGHDAAINIVRRLLQTQGAEVIHLGHDRAVEDIVTAVVQEDADVVAVSSYQGGHLEFFRYLIDRLRESGAGHVRVYGGGGGVISPEEIRQLHAYGVTRIFSPGDGQRLGLEGMIREILDAGSARPAVDPQLELEALAVEAPTAVTRLISWLEGAAEADEARLEEIRAALRQRVGSRPPPLVGFTGTGGAGKSTLVDEVVNRFRREFPARSVGIVSVDPTHRRSGGALLGDRLRMNSIEPPHIFVRSLATRQAHRSLSRAIDDATWVLKAAGFDLVIIETAGIGQADSEITERVDVSVYVMTPEFGAATQLEKTEMLEFADLVVVNKLDRRGGEDALHDVRKQWRRNRNDFERPDGQVPVYPTIASSWNDPGTDRFYQGLLACIAERGFEAYPRRVVPDVRLAEVTSGLPRIRPGYLAEIAETVRRYRERADSAAEAARELHALHRALEVLGEAPPGPSEAFADPDADPAGSEAGIPRLRQKYNEAWERLEPELREELAAWPELRDRYAGEEQSYPGRGREIRVRNYSETLSGLRVPRVVLPREEEWGSLVRYLRLENLPGRFPFTAGVFRFKRTEEEHTARMFAGEGTPERTNRRFHLLSRGQPAVRLSTAFDSVTLYGRDPEERPDVYGKIGTSGVSVCTIEDVKKLYSGFDLLDPRTSVSMTINGPAPILLAFFLNAAIDQAVEKHLRAAQELDAVRERLQDSQGPSYSGPLPEGHDGLGLALLGIPGDAAVDAETYARIRGEVLRQIRGTVQADILKEDQAQNTCIFSTEFALRMMGDVQRFFCENEISGFYSVSVSGYHIAEAGANPVTQLAFTLANGLTYCEHFLSGGLAIDDFAPSLSFFFSNGLDAEYAVIGRVARRIWAIALRERYGASERSQKLKYHIQTSGRSLHAQDMAFNDIRTTLQALVAMQDHCNSLHTNAYDEAITTPTGESVRRALAIQLILAQEFGVLANENPSQGAYLTDTLTDAVEAAVLTEFERLSDRGGVLGAMETNYQRSRIQDESLRYEGMKHSGELPIVGVNTFRDPDAEGIPLDGRELVRANEEERRAQLASLRRFQARHADRTPEVLERLQRVALERGNVFAELMDTVKVASLGQIVQALFEVGGRYRRAM